MASSADSDQLASSSQLIWIYTVCKGRVYLGSTGQGLTLSMLGKNFSRQLLYPQRMKYVRAYICFLVSSFIHLFIPSSFHYICGQRVSFCIKVYKTSYFENSDGFHSYLA